MADNPKEPYGSVTYADPGYQKDKVKRYPLDTEAHVRAAWSYINMPRNSQQYSAEELAAIKGRIKAAAKRHGITIADEDTADHTNRSRDDSAVETRIEQQAQRSEVGHPFVETRSTGRVDNVQVGQRIVTVLTVPYEEPAQIMFRGEPWQEIFSRTAFNGIEVRNRRIPVNREHNPAMFCGKVIETFPHNNDGLVTEIRISRTDLGDETLRLASDDDLAASAGFLVHDPYRDQQLDRHQKIRRINRAWLDHVALTGQPAYEGTKILAMRSSETSDEASLPHLAATPRIDQYLDDPVLRWASGRIGE